MVETVMRKKFDDFIGGIQTGGREITNLCYVNEIILRAQSVDKLQELVIRLDTVSRNNNDLHDNIDKTKIMATDGTPLYHDTELAAGASQCFRIS